MNATAAAPLDINRPDLTLGIVGTGIMGRGIAQIAAQSGIRTILYDTRSEAAAAARAYIGDQLGKQVARGKVTQAAFDATMAKLEVANVLPALSECHIIVEAIIEEIKAKQELFGHLEAIVAKDAILATNTSSLQVTAIAAGAKHPERVAGYHFFNPVPLMKVVEVIPGLLTEPAACDALVALSRRMGHTPVRAKDTPGFIVNHAGRGYGTEALQILREGVADYPAIDRVLREAAGFRMGPFELLDLTGLDVSGPAMESIYHQFYQEPRFRPSPLLGQRATAGLLGRKSNNRGFYLYDEKGQVAPPEPATPAVASIPPVWVSPSQLGPTLAEWVAGLGATLEHGAKPSRDALCLVAPLGHDATTSALGEGLDPARTVAVDCLLAAPKRLTLMTTPVTSAAARDAAHALLAKSGKPVTVIHDSAGFVSQRVLAHIVNIACDIAQQRIATPEDIDRAVTLGLGYPQGPLAWGDALGPRKVLAILEAVLGFSGDPRYRPSPWLRRRAMLGISLLSAEN